MQDVLVEGLLFLRRQRIAFIPVVMLEVTLDPFDGVLVFDAHHPLFEIHHLGNHFDVFHECVQKDLVRVVTDFVVVPRHLVSVDQLGVKVEAVFKFELLEQSENVVLAEAAGVGQLQRHEEHLDVALRTVIQKVDDHLQVLAVADSIEGRVPNFNEFDDHGAYVLGVSLVDEVDELLPVQLHVHNLDLLFVFAHADEKLPQLHVIIETKLLAVLENLGFAGNSSASLLLSLGSLLLLDVGLVVIDDLFVDPILVLEDFHIEILVVFCCQPTQQQFAPD